MIVSNVIVYRVEGPDGLGPYKSSVCVLDMDFWMKSGVEVSYQDHPTPHEEGVPIKEHEVCGFASREQAVKWFGHAGLRALVEKDFYLYGYTVPAETVKYGNCQVVFDPSLAKQRVRVL